MMARYFAPNVASQTVSSMGRSPVRPEIFGAQRPSTPSLPSTGRSDAELRREEKETEIVMIADPNRDAPLSGARMRGAVRNEIQVRLVAAATSVYSAGTTQGLLGYDPTSVTDFAAFANLFSEYKVDRVGLEMRIPPVNTTTDWTLIGICANDPGALIAAPTAVVVRLADQAKHLRYGNVTRLEGSPQKALTASAQPSKGGWLLKSQSWPGQFVFFLESANAASTAASSAYFREWVISFRSRYA